MKPSPMIMPSRKVDHASTVRPVETAKFVETVPFTEADQQD